MATGQVPTERSLSVLSDVPSLISACDHGWRFGFLYSASLFALCWEKEFYSKRKCSRVDQISVSVNFVPGQDRKYQPNLFSRTALTVHCRESRAGSCRERE